MIRQRPQKMNEMIFHFNNLLGSFCTKPFNIRMEWFNTGKEIIVVKFYANSMNNTTSEDEDGRVKKAG